MGTTVLAVDDSKTIRTIIKKMFSAFECTLYEADNGLKGLAVAVEKNPDLIILDIDMPGLNGLEVLMKLRNDDKFMKTPVFMLTAKSKEANIRIAMELGVSAFIAKPFKKADLLDRVQSVLLLKTKEVS